MLLLFYREMLVMMELKKNTRGMSWIRDIEDWLGGLPYECARPQVVQEFVERRGFSLVRQAGLEYLFRRKQI